MSWAEYASCAGSDPEAWFPKRHRPPKILRRVCGGCYVRAECAADAIYDEFGFRAGMTQSERRRRRKELGMADYTFVDNGRALPRRAGVQDTAAVHLTDEEVNHAAEMVDHYANTPEEAEMFKGWLGLEKKVDPECRRCQGTGMATLNPDEEPGSHVCEREA